MKSALRRFEPDQLTRLVVRASEVDSVIKGVLRGSPWDELVGLVMEILDRDFLRSHSSRERAAPV